MFAGAAREAVFSQPEVIRRVQRDFVPVALKAALVNHPPRGSEGELLREIGRSKPAPQGICVANSAGKVLDWVLMFDDEPSLLAFMEHTGKRYQQFPDARQPVPAERFMRFPSHKLPDVPDATRPIPVPDEHAADDACPGRRRLPPGTLVGRIIGRALDKEGRPLSDTLRQEHYMEARFELPLEVQQSLVQALQQGAGGRFELPEPFVRTLVAHAYLGQLDVSPLGTVPGSKNISHRWQFSGQVVGQGQEGVQSVYFRGTSAVAGCESSLGFNTDGRDWEHEVTLEWEGYIDVQIAPRRLTRLAVLARGKERLRWDHARRKLSEASDVANLPAGRAIDQQCGVVYGLTAEPCQGEEAEGALPERDTAHSQP